MAGEEVFVELNVFAMVVDDDGGRTAQTGEKPAFYDVLLKRVNTGTGEIETLEEHENLTLSQAERKANYLETREGLQADWIGG